MPASLRPRSSLIVWHADDGKGDSPGAILRLVIDRLRVENRLDGAREISLALQRCEEGLHWIEHLEAKRIGGQDGRED